MTTIPVELHELLERVADHLEWDGSEPMTTIQYAYRCDELAADLRALLSEQPQADHSAQDLNMVEQPQAGAGQEVRRVLLLTSYCDENGCKDGAPCIECLRMCNVAMVSGDVSVVGQYDHIPGCCLTTQPPARHDQGDHDPMRQLANTYKATAMMLSDEVRRLREALEFACKSLAIVTSSDGSGHVDIALIAMRMAGLHPDESEPLVAGWKAKAQWRADAALTHSPKGEEE